MRPNILVKEPPIYYEVYTCISHFSEVHIMDFTLMKDLC